MSKEVRMGRWQPDEDATLTQVVLDEVRAGGTQQDAFHRAGNVLSRTARACAFRWNNEIRPHFKEELKVAVREGRFATGKIRSMRVPEHSVKNEELKEAIARHTKWLEEQEAELAGKVKDKELVGIPPTPTHDPIIPSHYHKGGIDVIGYLEEHFGKSESYTVAEGFFIGNIIKYVSRYKQKNGVEDLKKALYYLEKLKQQGE
jgi:RsfA family transcription factor